MIVLDTSGLFAALNKDETHHARVRATLEAERGPWIVPAAILGELTYLIEQRLTASVLNAFIQDLRDGVFAIDCGEDDLPRVHELVRRYADFPLGFVDAAVIACAERSGRRVLTLDLRHFGVVGRESNLLLLPQ